MASWGAQWDVHSNSLYLPIYTRYGERVGFVLRGYDGRIPKCKTYKVGDGGGEDAPPALAWYRTRRRPALRPDAVVLAEDQLSAMHISSAGYDAVALLGTHLGSRQVAQLADLYSTCVIWLDYDAAGVAFRYQKKFAPWFADVHVIVYDLDPKDTPIDFIKNRLELEIGKEPVSGHYPGSEGV